MVAVFKRGHQADMMETIASNGMAYVISLPWAPGEQEYLRSIHYISQVLTGRSGGH